jgi:hypothetical protein
VEPEAGPGVICGAPEDCPDAQAVRIKLIRRMDRILDKVFIDPSEVVAVG